MEKPASAYLEQSLRAWRQEIGQSTAFKSENVEELETHLRDSIRKLQTVGLSEGEALTIAIGRLGAKSLLEKEYTKINPGRVWSHRVLWMLVGVQVWGFSSSIENVVMDNTTFLLFKCAGLNWSWTSGLGLTVTVFLLAHLLGILAVLRAGWWLLNTRGERFGGWLSKKMISAQGAVSIFAGAFALWIVLYGLSLGSTLIKIKLAGVSEFGRFSLPQSYAFAILGGLKTAACIGAIVFLVRRELRHRTPLKDA